MKSVVKSRYSSWELNIFIFENITWKQSTLDSVFYWRERLAFERYFRRY